MPPSRTAELTRSWTPSPRHRAALRSGPGRGVGPRGEKKPTNTTKLLLWRKSSTEHSSTLPARSTPTPGPAREAPSEPRGRARRQDGPVRWRRGAAAGTRHDGGRHPSGPGPGEDRRPRPRPRASPRSVRPGSPAGRGEVSRRQAGAAGPAAPHSPASSPPPSPCRGSAVPRRAGPLTLPPLSAEDAAHPSGGDRCSRAARSPQRAEGRGEGGGRTRGPLLLLLPSPQRGDGGGLLPACLLPPALPALLRSARTASPRQGLTAAAAPLAGPGARGAGRRGARSRRRTGVGGVRASTRRTWGPRWLWGLRACPRPLPLAGSPRPPRPRAAVLSAAPGAAPPGPRVLPARSGAEGRDVGPLGGACPRVSFYRGAAARWKLTAWEKSGSVLSQRGTVCRHCDTSDVDKFHIAASLKS